MKVLTLYRILVTTAWEAFTVGPLRTYKVSEKIFSHPSSGPEKNYWRKALFREYGKTVNCQILSRMHEEAEDKAYK